MINLGFKSNKDLILKLDKIIALMPRKLLIKRPDNLSQPYSQVIQLSLSN